MYEEVQVLSALVPTRKLYLLRFCQQIEQGSWAIVDVSYDVPHQETQFSSSCKAQRLPSGCLITEMPNGYSEVVCVCLYVYKFGWLSSSKCKLQY